MGCGIGDGDAIGPKRDAAGIGEERRGGDDVVRVGDGAVAGDDAALPPGVDFGDVVERAANGEEEVVESVEGHGIDAGQAGGIGGVDGAIGAEADDVSASETANSGIGDEDVTCSIDGHGGGRNHTRALGHDDLSGTAAGRIEEDIGGGRAVSLLEDVGVAGGVGGDGDGGAQAGSTRGGHARSQQAERADAEAP